MGCEIHLLDPFAENRRLWHFFPQSSPSVKALINSSDSLTPMRIRIVDCEFHILVMAYF